MKRTLLVVVLSLLFAGASYAQSNVGLNDKGVGMYTGPSVVNQVSTFTLTNDLVSCGVGTVNTGGLLGLLSFGPFEMLMFSLDIDSYTINRSVPRTIFATGTMRSTTRVAGLIIEDTDGTFGNPPPHDFTAVGEDKDPPQKDRFTIHFTTPFWNPGNPLCTPSDRFPGKCMFGDKLFLGNIVVSGQTF